MMGLTPKQRELYDFIAATIGERGFAPTFDEMAAALGYKSKGQVAQFIAILEERGCIRRVPAKARAIELMHPASSVTLNSEILTLTDRYAAAEGVSRDTAANQILREWLSAYFRSAA